MVAPVDLPELVQIVFDERPHQSMNCHAPDKADAVS
jgi:hypothetical protein